LGYVQLTFSSPLQFHSIFFSIRLLEMLRHFMNFYLITGVEVNASSNEAKAGEGVGEKSVRIKRMVAIAARNVSDYEVSYFFFLFFFFF
jgi:hypothetical protein